MAGKLPVAPGELESVDYAAGTADLAFSYDPPGRPETVTDAIGTRTFM